MNFFKSSLPIVWPFLYCMETFYRVSFDSACGIPYQISLILRGFFYSFPHTTCRVRPSDQCMDSYTRVCHTCQSASFNKYPVWNFPSCFVQKLNEIKTLIIFSIFIKKQNKSIKYNRKWCIRVKCDTLKRFEMYHPTPLNVTNRSQDLERARLSPILEGAAQPGMVVQRVAGA
jgi:hypothetical protein